MKLFFEPRRAALAIAFSAILCACGVSVEQPPGNKVRASATLAGNWDTSIDVKGTRRGVLSIQAAGDELLLQWQGEGSESANAHAAVFEFQGKQYVSISNSNQTDGYVIVRLDDASSEHIQAHTLDGERAAQLLRQMKRPVIYRERWLRKELFLDNASFAALMEHHADALFDKGVAVTLDKVR